MKRGLNRKVLGWSSAALGLAVAAVLLVAAMGGFAGGADRAEASNLAIDVPAGWDARGYPETAESGATLQLSNIPIPEENERPGIAAADQLPAGAIYVNISQDDAIPMPESYPRVHAPTFSPSDLGSFEGFKNPNVAIKTVRVDDHVVHVLVAVGGSAQAESLVARANEVLATLEV